MKTNKSFLALMASLGLACLIGLSAGLQSKVEVVETVRTGSRQWVVVMRVYERVYVGLPHGAGWYLSKGKTQIEGVSGRQRWDFQADEELDLVGFHEVEDGILLICLAHYRPERGFLAFHSSEGGDFAPISLAEVPPRAAFANFGSRGKTARGFFDGAESGAGPPEGFYDSTTAWLWSQMATNQPVLGNQLSMEAVRECWKKWSPVIAEEIRATKN
jgi:hypothetical protein